MQKKFIAVLIAAMLLIPLCSSSCNKQEGFAIYLTRDDIPVSQMAQMEALSYIEIAEKPIISADDIISYDRDTHEIEISTDAYERIKQPREYVVGQVFVACVNKQPIYWGAFWSLLSSSLFDGVTIIRPFSISTEQGYFIQIQLGYPGEDFYQGEDPRSNPEILDSLEKAGKLK